MVYYLAKDGIKTGALTRFQVLERIESGEADATTLAWVQGMTEWRPLGALPEFENEFWVTDAEEDGEGGKGGGEELREPEPKMAREGGAAGAALERPLPWMRLFARGVDIILLVVVFEFGFSVLMPGVGLAVADSFTARVVAHAVMIVCWCFIEALFLSTWGYTPGKALFRVEVRDSRGAILGYKRALQRAILVWVKGLALMFVWVTPIAMMIAHARLMVFGTTTWDRDLRIRVTHGRPGPVRIAAVLAIYATFGYLIYESVRLHLEKDQKEEKREGGESRPGEGEDETGPAKNPPPYFDDLV